MGDVSCSLDPLPPFPGDFTLSQTPVICKYLGKKFGLYPETEEDEFHAEQINTTLHDFLAEGECHNVTVKDKAMLLEFFLRIRLAAIWKMGGQLL